VAKSEKEIMGEIQAIIRQITASVTFLPMLEDKCTFDLLVYTKADSEVPQQWCVPPSRTRWGVEVSAWRSHRRPPPSNVASLSPSHLTLTWAH
jgi:hypothetical protein